ncbi:MAG: hypothetical protein A2Y76_12855 [Planctomycetes bacterium RBG_13_60_9]|nr:MAG: hypothetical protein A2Y76_12855 [Planctomycetes bacterium RBG_13_60_9]
MIERETNHVAREHDPGQLACRKAQSLAFVTGVGICLVLSLYLAAGAFTDSAGLLNTHPSDLVNPNDAPVASLVRLPGIGLARARAIVAYRDQLSAQAGPRPVFAATDDLRQIKGIGPAIVNDIRPWLQFDSRSSDANRPSHTSHD